MTTIPEDQHLFQFYMNLQDQEAFKRVSFWNLPNSAEPIDDDADADEFDDDAEAYAELIVKAAEHIGSHEDGR